MIIFGGSAGTVLATRTSQLLGVKLGRFEATEFPDGEKYVRFHDNIKGEDVVLIHPMGLKPDSLLIEYLLAASALRDGEAKSVTTVIPYFAYARQDARFNPGEPLSFHLIAKFIEMVGADMIYTIDLHLQRVPDLGSLLKIATKNLTAVPEVAVWIKKNVEMNNPVVIGPDLESEQWAKVAAEKIGTSYEIMMKTRYSATEVSITTKDGKPLDLTGKEVVIIDDIISSGGTIVEAVKLLREAGAKKVVVGCTHPVLSGNALSNIYSSGVDIVVGTDTVPSQVSYVSVAPIIATALREKL
ncbi:MAG: ribose-phosphate diphosphokinase [Nitrososphaerales archaeon]